MISEAPPSLAERVRVSMSRPGGFLTTASTRDGDLPPDPPFLSANLLSEAYDEDAAMVWAIQESLKAVEQNESVFGPGEFDGVWLPWE